MNHKFDEEIAALESQIAEAEPSRAFPTTHVVRASPPSIGERWRHCRQFVGSTHSWPYVKLFKISYLDMSHLCT